MASNQKKEKFARYDKENAGFNFNVDDLTMTVRLASMCNRTGHQLKNVPN